MEELLMIQGVVVVLLAVLVAGLLRSHAEILRRLHALGGGEDFDRDELWTPRTIDNASTVSTDSISGTTPAGGAGNIALLGTRGLTLLAFLSTTCNGCRPFWEEFGEVSLGGEEARVVIVTKSPPEERAEKVAEMARAEAMTLMSSEAWEVFQVPATPHFVLVDTRNGSVVGEGHARSWTHLNDLLGRAVSGRGGADRRSPRARASDTDEELSRAGIEPGDPRLYQPPEESSE